MGAISIPRRTSQPKDVQIEILYCGICHSDVHFMRNEFANIMPSTYPCIPGHEIVGRVVKIGNAVTKFKEGDLAAVGCMMDSDRTCDACREGEEQFCASRPVFIYNGPRQASRRRDLRRVFTKHRRRRRFRSPCAEKL